MSRRVDFDLSPGSSTVSTAQTAVSTTTQVIRHELFHTAGAVSACAPHRDSASSHVTDVHDLMSASTSDPALSVLDLGRDDYWGHGTREGDGEIHADLLLSPIFD